MARHTRATDWGGRIAIVAGNESAGLDAGPAIDQWVRIEHRGRAESLNVAMATTVLCFEALRQRRRRATDAAVNEPGRDRILRLEWLSLAAALTPVVVAVGRAIVKDWMPVGDATYFTVRSADVLTEHHPLVGAWSSGSLVVGVPVNNLGPLQLDVLAPFTKLTPYVGTAIGSALISAASIVIVWTVARRMFRPAVVVGVMVGTTLFVASLGLSWLIDARQQQAMVLPLYALLWLSAAMWLGVRLAVPIAVVVASLVVQTHFTYGYPATLVFIAGLVASSR